MPAAAAAFSIGTAKPMPMKTRWSVGFEDGGDDADHLAVHRHQRAAGIAGVGGGVELDQVGQQLLAVGRAELALQARRRRPPTTDGPMPNGKPTAITWSPGARSAVERIVAATRSSGMVLRLQHREVVLRLGR